MTRRSAFGEKVHGLRLSRGLSLRALAEQLKCTAAYVCDIEWGRRNPPGRDLIEGMAVILGTDREELIRLAMRERNRVDVSVESKPETVRNMVFSLARAVELDEIDDETVKKIVKALEQRQREAGK